MDTECIPETTSEYYQPDLIFNGICILNTSFKKPFKFYSNSGT